MSVMLAVGDTQQMTATLYDALDNVLTGRAVAWSSSDPTIASVSGSGLVTAVGPGTATINAASGGKAGTDAVTVVTPAAATIDADMMVPAQRSMPAILVDDAESSPGTYGVSRSGLHYDYIQIRSKSEYPSADGVWRVGFDQATGPLTNTVIQAEGAGIASITDNYRAAGMPTPGARVWHVTFNPGSGEAVLYCPATVPMVDGANPLPDQDGPDFKRCWNVDFKALDAILPIGATFHVEQNSQWYGDVVIHNFGDVAINDSNWHSYDFDCTAADIAAGGYLRIIIPGGATRILGCAVAGMILAGRRSDPVEGNRPVPGYWDERHGAALVNGAWNAHTMSDDPPTSDGAGKTATAIPTPDSDTWYAGDTVNEFVLLANRGRAITDDVPVKLARIDPGKSLGAAGEPSWPLDKAANGDPMDAYAHLGHFFQPSSTGYLPPDGEIEGEYEACTGVVLDVNGRPTSWNLTGIKYRGLLYRDPANAPTTRTSDNATFYDARIQLMQANEHYLWFMPRIQNPTGVDKTVRGTRVFCEPEGFTDDRNRGLREAMVPRRTRGKPDYNGGQFLVISDMTRHISVHEGFMLWRFAIPYWSPGDMISKGILVKRDCWQSGTYGDYRWETFCAFIPNTVTGLVALTMGLDQGDTSYKGFSFNAYIPQGMGYWPTGTIFDIGKAWKLNASTGAIEARCFLGIGGGTDLTVYKAGQLPNLFGQPTTLVERGGLDWALTDGGGDTHIGVADRDRTGNLKGFLRKGPWFGNAVDWNLIEDQMRYRASKWGARRAA